MAQVKAPVNFALIKYWGKRDDTLNLPSTSSLSITLKELYTITRADFYHDVKIDEITINQASLNQNEANKILKHLDFLKTYFNKKGSFIIHSENNFPKNAGLASSASGFCALTTACILAINGQLPSNQELSSLCRRGSGSSCRSIYGGFVLWNKGEKNDGNDSIASQLYDERHWNDLRCIVVCISQKEKSILSSIAMKKSRDTSPLYQSWIDSHSQDLQLAISAIAKKDLLSLSHVIEHNCMKMFATQISSLPPILYWQAETIQLLHLLHDLKNQGFELGYTMDAGPQVKIIVNQKNCKSLEKIITKNIPHDFLVISEIGQGMQVLQE